MPVLDYLVEQRRVKHARYKNGKPRSRVAGADNAGWFKPSNVGPENPSWKGGPFKKYGLSIERYDEILAMQNGVCAICHQPPKKNRLCVDHNHTTGAVRGLLCFRCNYGMSWFQDDSARIRRLAEYLETEQDLRDLKCQ